MEPIAREHVLKSVEISDNARLHFGDVYNTYSSVKISGDSRIHLGDQYHYYGGAYRADALIGRAKRLQNQLDDGLRDFRVALAELEEGTLGEDRARQYNEMLLSCDVLNISIAGQSEIAMRRARKTRSGGGLSSEEEDELEKLADFTEKLIETVGEASVSLKSFDRTFTFDQQLYRSQVYGGGGGGSAFSPEVDENETTDSSNASSDFASTPVSSDAASSMSFETATSSFFGSAGTDERATYAASSYAEVEVVGRDQPHGMTALLDTGAFQDCISEALWSTLELASQTRKHAKPKTIRLGNRTTVQSSKVVSLKWKFKKKKDEYSLIFYVVDNLAHDLILSGPSIFKHEFLSNNPEICVLGLPEHLRPDFENVLSPLGLPRLSDDQAQEQQQRVGDRARENEVSRDVDLTEIQRLGEEKKRKIEEQRRQKEQERADQAQPQPGPSGRR